MALLFRLFADQFPFFQIACPQAPFQAVDHFLPFQALRDTFWNSSQGALTDIIKKKVLVHGDIQFVVQVHIHLSQIYLWQ